MNVKAVIPADVVIQKQWCSKFRGFKKVGKIGLLGVLNGVRIRSWFRVGRPDVEKEELKLVICGALKLFAKHYLNRYFVK